MLAALTKYLSRHFSSFKAWEKGRDQAREGDSIPVYLTECVHVGVDLCAFLTATVMHACPGAGHKSSLEMAGVVCVCSRVYVNVPSDVPIEETVACDDQQAALLLLLQCCVPLCFQGF